MTEPESASEHLRVIRQLMERATIYRAISAPTALIGGVAALALAWWQHRVNMPGKEFLESWLGLFAVLAAVNLSLLWRDARQRGQPFFSSGMRLALRALGPPLLCGGVLGIGFGLSEMAPAFCAILWCIFYGLALLATASFAPSSMLRLGSCFVAVGLISFVAFFNEWVPGLTAEPIMAVTFGLFHIVYGLSVLICSRRAA